MIMKTNSEHRNPRWATWAAICLFAMLLSGWKNRELDTPPEIQDLDARIELADGQSLMRRFEEDGLSVEFAEGDRPVSTTVLLPMFGVASMPYRLTGDGPRIVLFRFDPHDLGKVAFSRTPLMREGARLILERHGRRLTFRPVKGGCGNGQPD